jgi:sec-independent protein translocase protein TatA
MLGLDNPIHLAFILILLLLVFGAKRLPEMGRSLGSGLRGFKESISGDEPHSTIAEHTPTPFVPPVSTSEPDRLPAEPAERAPASTAV